MKMTKPDPKTIKNFPLDNPKAGIVCERGNLYVCERQHFWNPETKKKSESRLYIGRIVDGVYYSMEQYRRKFKRDGSLRTIERPKARPYRRKTAENNQAQETAATASTEQLTPSALQTKRIGATTLFIEIAKQIGLWEDLCLTWGEAACRAACSLASHWLMTAKNASYLYESWSQNYLLPFPRTITAKEVTEFFAELGGCAGWEKTFFGARIQRMGEDEIFSYDATNIATKAYEIKDAQYGKSKDGGYRRQIGMSVLFGHNSQMPAMFRIFPGNIADVSTVADLLTRVDLIDEGRVIAAVLDRGYFSLENLAECVDAGHKVLIAAKMDVGWVKDAAEQVLSDLWDARTRLRGCTIWGKTVQKEMKFADGKKRTLWVHVFRDEMTSHTANQQLFDEIEAFENQWKAADYANEQTVKALRQSQTLKYFMQPKGDPGTCSLERNYDAINAASRYFGFFASVSTMPCDAQTAIETYHNRDNIEKCFKAGKSDINMDAVRSHSDATMKGRFIVSFCALTILCELRRRMRRPYFEMGSKGEVKHKLPPLADEMTFGALLNYLDSVKVSYGNKPEDIRLEEVTNKQQMIAKRLGCPGVFDAVPDYARTA